MFYEILAKLALKALKHDQGSLFEKERCLSDREGFVKAAPNSPEKGWPDPWRTEKLVQLPFKPNEIGTFAPIVASVTKTCNEGIKSLDRNPKNPKTKVDEKFLADFEEYARTLGIGTIGYAKVPRELIFSERAILGENAIVFTMEMGKEKIEMAPSKETQVMVFKTYDRLGKVVTALTEYLRENGYEAQTGYPLGGHVLYPAVAQLAGLGWHGRHGLLITPEFGPRQRIAAIFTNIGNLPFSTHNPHSWIGEFCSSCGKCIKACPAKAIMETPRENDNGTTTHIIRDRCFPYFYENHVCGVCLKTCAFNKGSYHDIKKSFLKDI